MKRCDSCGCSGVDDAKAMYDRCHQEWLDEHNQTLEDPELPKGVREGGCTA